MSIIELSFERKGFLPLSKSLSIYVHYVKQISKFYPSVYSFTNSLVVTYENSAILAVLPEIQY